MSSLLCIAGPPGAGKSTVSAFVSAEPLAKCPIRGMSSFGFWTRARSLHGSRRRRTRTEIVFELPGPPLASTCRAGSTRSSMASSGRGGCRPFYLPRIAA